MVSCAKILKSVKCLVISPKLMDPKAKEELRNEVHHLVSSSIGRRAKFKTLEQYIDFAENLVAQNAEVCIKKKI